MVLASNLVYNYNRGYYSIMLEIFSHEAFSKSCFGELGQPTMEMLLCLSQMQLAL